MRLSRKVYLTLVCLILVGSTSCVDYSIQLPGGYSLVRVYRQAVVISHPDKGIVIEANIDKYKVMGSLVVGHVILAERPPESEYSKPGYFILNTFTHEYRQGLDKGSWLDALRAAGVASEPKLDKPSRFDNNY